MKILKRLSSSFLLLTLLSLIVYLRIENYLITSLPARLNLYENKKPELIQRSSQIGSYLAADNVLFRFKENIILLLKNVNGEVMPTEPLTVSNLDDVNAFRINVFKADVYIESKTLLVIFKDYIFNYPDSPLKLKEIYFPEANANKIKMTGSLNFIIWIDFELIAKITLDDKKEKIAITAEEMKALSSPYAKSLLDVVGLNLEKLLPVPDGRGIQIRANQILVDPFSIFPPPKLSGTIVNLEVKESKLHLGLDNANSIVVPTLPYPLSKNYLFFSKGI